MKLLNLVLLIAACRTPCFAAEENGPERAPASAQSDSFFSKVKPGLWNSFLFYNKENGAWEQTSITITYFENVFQPFLQFDLGDKARFRAGAGLVIPINQEQKVRSAYPYIQSKIYLKKDSTLDLGSLENNHDFPAPLMDPLTTLLPQLRLGDSSQVPTTYETYPTGIFTHGLYEYGVSYRWGGFLEKESNYLGELYLNWQLQDSTNHRERFDIGYTTRFPIAGIPLYFAAHYWHNGGHENPHPVEVTENYTAGFGLRNNTFNALILGSALFPDRSKPELTKTGLALYVDYRFVWGEWFLQPLVFVSDELRNPSNKFVSVEGDPFFRVPFYAGFNFGRTWEVWKNCNLDLRFVNGFFQRFATGGFKPSVARYDQMLRFQINYVFGNEG